MTANEKEPTSTADATRSVGRGAIYLTLTKFWFLISGYAIYFALPRILGDGETGKELFGKYGIITGFGAILNALVIQGTTQAVARFVGRNPENGDGVRRAAYKLQALLGGGLFLAFFLSSEWIAVRWYKDASLATPFRYAAFILLFYAFYAIFMGYLNGRRLFARQALIDFSYSTLKVAGVLLGALLLKDWLGAIVAPIFGFAAAAGVVMVMGYVLCGRARGPGSITVKELLGFQVFTMAFTFCATWVARGDLQILKWALATEMSTKQLDLMAAEYVAAQAFATIPYQAVFAITFVLFPLVSGVAGRDADKLRTYIAQTTRWASIIAIAIVSLFFAVPERTITILFRADYAPAASTLQILLVGYLCYSIFFVICAVITASGRPRLSLGLIALTVLLQVGVGWSLVYGYGAHGVATGTAAGMLTGLVLGNLILLRTFGQGIVLSSLAKTFGCGVTVGLAAHALMARQTFWGGTGVFAEVGGTGVVAKGVTVAGMSVLGVVYVVLLVVTRVLGNDDVARFKKVIKRS